MYWLLEAYILKYRYIHELIYAVFGVCLVCLIHIHAHSAGISSWVWHLQLSYGMTIILERLCISPTEAICQGNKPYMQQDLRLKSEWEFVIPNWVSLFRSFGDPIWFLKYTYNTKSETHLNIRHRSRRHKNEKQYAMGYNQINIKVYSYQSTI